MEQELKALHTESEREVSRKHGSYRNEITKADVDWLFEFPLEWFRTNTWFGERTPLFLSTRGNWELYVSRAMSDAIWNLWNGYMRAQLLRAYILQSEYSERVQKAKAWKEGVEGAAERERIVDSLVPAMRAVRDRLQPVRVRLATDMLCQHRWDIKFGAVSPAAGSYDPHAPGPLVVDNAKEDKLYWASLRSGERRAITGGTDDWALAGLTGINLEPDRPGDRSSVKIQGLGTGPLPF